MPEYITLTPQTLPTITQGDDYAVVATIQKDGATYDITGATVTCSIHDRRHPATGIINDHAVTITTAASGIVTLTLTDTETATLRAPHERSREARMHVADFKVVESGGAIIHSEPVLIPVRRAVT